MTLFSKINNKNDLVMLGNYDFVEMRPFKRAVLKRGCILRACDKRDIGPT